jgi:hypothetical protein
MRRKRGKYYERRMRHTQKASKPASSHSINTEKIVVEVK